ncbi:MAG TPA: hypothetical protein VHR66_08930 [Gemmataceae bacterium]|nr:hypothetical protein [Gemmataceae bacterium]
MNRIGCWLLAILVPLPASQGDEPKDKSGKRGTSPKEDYAALVVEFTTRQRAILAEARKAEGEERQKLFEKIDAVGRDFAAKFLKLAEDNPKDPIVTEAYFWIVQHAGGSDAYAKASDKVKALINELPIKDLLVLLVQVKAANDLVIDAILKRAEKDEKDALAGDLLAYAARNGFVFPAGKKAIGLMLEKYSEHAAFEQFVEHLYGIYSGDAERTLKTILQQNSQPKVKAAAARSLGHIFVERCDELAEQPAAADKMAAEADKYLTQAIGLYGKDRETQKKDAEGELNALRALRIGKEAPEIIGRDPDGKEFKLSDYRGKVVLLDFWGNW